ncbi:YpbF family protein [Metabacillus sp. KIGAM252]|uniref:YpbF family protein n=1 Tax=Metabacillus flavus TaxID=2823519 RepID=A0ABS5LFR4_9BACI|nr:YpbF family protein [Metabacillus flavus]MBS2969443.1 YpbF family protein [Metabacillus flavus]
MEKAIEQLEPITDEPTKKMLQSLVDKKRKFERLKKKVLSLQLTSFLCMIIFMVYFYKVIVLTSENSLSIVLSRFVDESFHLYFIVAIAGAYATALYFKKKEVKAETEYHALRCEVIRKSGELWPQPYHWKKRTSVFQMMKNEFDINLFYESK